MQLIDGNAIATSILAELNAEVAGFTGSKPKVVFVRVGDDPASIAYVNKKQKVSQQIGIQSELRALDETISQDDLFAIIDELNADPTVHGILVQAPLPKHMNEIAVFNRVNPRKDVDGFNTVNIGKLCQEDANGFVACTPAGIIELLKRTGIDTTGKKAVVVGRSQIVGKPVALLLMMKTETGNATVSICHSKTNDLTAEVKSADIVIAAIGRPHFITADMVQPGAVVIDVGINRVEDTAKPRGYRLVGDVDFDQVAPQAAYITPVPGGVGPMTVAMLMKNTVKAYRLATHT